MKKYLLITAVCWTFGSLAQMGVDTYDSVVYHHVVGVDGFGDYGASALQNGVANKFVFGGFIDSTTKNNSFNRHRGVNRIGVVANGEVYYRNYDARILKNKEWGFEIVAAANYFGGALYTRDMFGLGMYGNLNYVGDTLSMSGMNISFTGMQKVGFGLIDVKTKSSVRLNLYNISSRFDADFRDLELIQSEDGYEMTLVMDGEVEMSQSAKFNQGFGAGVDVDIRIPISWVNEREARLQFKAENIGFGYMYEPQKRYNFDTTITFDGFRFNQLVSENGYFSDSLSLLDTLGINSSETKSGFLLPGYIQIGKMIDRNADYKLQSFFGVRIYPTLIYSPFAFAGVDYKFTDHVRAGLSVSYGGFSGVRVGAYGQFNWDRFGFGLGSDNFSGFMRSGGNGTSLYASAVCRF